jgi:hypothetical protein
MKQIAEEMKQIVKERNNISLERSSERGNKIIGEIIGEIFE